MEEILKKLKLIEPSEEYKTDSLRLILTQPQNPNNRISPGIFDVFKFGAALGLAGTLIMVSISSFFPTLNARLLSPVLLSNLDKKKIQNEANQLDIKITINEAKYYTDSLQKVAVALDKTSKTSPDHLNSDILNNEVGGLNIDQQNNEDLNEMLDKLTM